MKRFFFLLITASLSSPAMSQRSEDNAILDAEDAFGSNDGGEDLGLYAPADVRGFSPIAAGNVRIEGLYFDRQADLSPRLVEGSRIRVGPAVTAYPFPSPSGLVDYRLRTPGDKAALSAVSQVDSFGGALVELDFELPVVAGNLAVGGGFGLRHAEYASGNNADILNLAVIGVWRPAPATEAKLFWSRTRIADEDIFPIILGDGEGEPERIARRRFIGQHWADVETRRTNYGVLVQTQIGKFAVRAGAFRSLNIVPEGHSVFLDAAPPGTIAGRSVVGNPRRSNIANSAEIGIARNFGSGDLEHRLLLIFRGRSQDRIYGGSQRVSLAPAAFGQPLFVKRADFDFGAQTDDRVRQWSAGLGYHLSFGTIGRVEMGIQRVDYRKAVTTPTGPRPPSTDRPWLANVAATINLGPDLSLYGSFMRGLEESDVAPEIAINRGEAPPAIKTRQIDAGIRMKFSGMTVITGVFEIVKPYFGLDSANVFRELGNVTHRGVETSISGTVFGGLTLVGGATLVDPRLSGAEVETGLIGRRPVDVAKRKAIISADWRAPSSHWSIDVNAEYIGGIVADTQNRVKVGSSFNVDLGLRYRFRVLNKAALVRLQATNLFNEYSWGVSGNNAFVYSQPRQVTARLAIDF